MSKYPQDWKLIPIKNILKESKINPEFDDPSKRISVRLHCEGIEKRTERATDQTGATRYYKRLEGQFIYGKQNLHKGALGIVPNDLHGFCSSQDIPAFDFMPGIYPNWFLQLFSQSYFYESLEKIATGTGSKRIQPSALGEKEIVIPPLPEQKKIAEIILSIQKLIDKISQEIDKLHLFKKSIIGHLTTKGISNIDFKDTKLGKLPKSWDVISVDLIANIIDPQPDHRTPPSVKNGIPYISSGDIKNDGTLDFKNCRKVSYSVLSKQIEQFNIYENAFIFGKIGTIGKPVQISSERAFCLSANIILITSKNLLNQRFLYQLFSSDLINNQVSDQTNTTSQPALGIKKVRNFLIPMPPEQERIKICKILESVDENILIKQKMLSKNKFLKSSLMSDLFTGRKRVEV